MKNLLKIAAFALVLVFMSSCKDDDNFCVSCDAFEDAASGISADAWSGCEGEDDGTGVIATKADLELAKAFHVGLGGSCD